MCSIEDLRFYHGVSNPKLQSTPLTGNHDHAAHVSTCLSTFELKATSSGRIIWRRTITVGILPFQHPNHFLIDFQLPSVITTWDSIAWVNWIVHPLSCFISVDLTAELRVPNMRIWCSIWMSLLGSLRKIGIFQLVRYIPDQRLSYRQRVEFLKYLNFIEFNYVELWQLHRSLLPQEVGSQHNFETSHFKCFTCRTEHIVSTKDGSERL